MGKEQSRRIGVLTVFLLGSFMWIIVTACVGCGSPTGGRDDINSTVKESASFNATVLEVNDTCFLVRPFDGESELKSADQILITNQLISSHSLPELEVGTKVRIVYKGGILESYPAQINEVFSVYLVDDAGNVLEN